MSVVGNQRQIFLRLAAELRPHWRRDPAFPVRLQAALSRQRNFGSRDRRLYRELLYTAVRYAPWIEPRLDRDPEDAAATVAWLAADLPATQLYRATLTAGRPACPATLAAKADLLQASPASLVPDWLQAECPAVHDAVELDALHRRAPLWLRLQTDDPAPVFEEFAAHGWKWRVSPLRPEAVELLSEADVTRTDAYRTGRVEIQDLGSQLVLVAADVTAGSRWLDACAGAGGKTLQLARLLGPGGHVDAHDIRPEALDELAHRTARASLGHVSILRQAPTGTYDGVLVDAPCSGSGTWRRSPHLKWTSTPEQLTRLAATQLALLVQNAALVRPGGLLVYATCSLARRENAGVVETFLQQTPAFAPVANAGSLGLAVDGPGLAIRPARHDTDGFYVAVLRRR